MAEFLKTYPAVGATIVSTLVALIWNVFSFCKNKEMIRWQKKYDLLCDIIAYKSDYASKENIKNLNSIAGIFYDSPKVSSSYKNYIYCLQNKESSSEKKTDLHFAMIDSMFENLKINANYDKNLMKLAVNSNP